MVHRRAVGCALLPKIGPPIAYQRAGEWLHICTPSSSLAALHESGAGTEPPDVFGAIHGECSADGSWPGLPDKQIKPASGWPVRRAIPKLMFDRRVATLAVPKGHARPVLRNSI